MYNSIIFSDYTVTFSVPLIYLLKSILFLSAFTKSKMRQNCLTLMIGCCFVLLSGCAGKLQVIKQYRDDSFSIDKIRDSASIRVVVMDNIDLQGFRKSFDKEYQSTQTFALLVGKQIADSMKSMLGCSVTVSQNPQEGLPLIDQTYSESTLTAIQSLWASTAEEYYFLVESIIIKSNRETSLPMVAPTGPGGMGSLVWGGTSETCVVHIQAKLWDVKQKKKILVYFATGEQNVTMFCYGTALKDAVTKSINTTVRYLALGES
jgi:hypothetical protein